jgi:hypothetical protein
MTSDDDLHGIPGQAVKHRYPRHPRALPGAQYGEVPVRQQAGNGDGDDVAPGVGQPDDHPGHPDHNLVPAAEPNLVPDTEFARPVRPSHPVPGNVPALTRVSAVSLTAMSANSAYCHSNTQQIRGLNQSRKDLRPAEC